MGRLSGGFGLLIAIVLAVVLGIVCGWIWGPAMASVAWMGTLFLNALKMVIIPLIICAVISGVGSLGDIRKLGRIGGVTVGYYATTTAVAVLIGLVVVNVIQPGVGVDISHAAISEHVRDKQSLDVSDILFSMVSPNLVVSAAEAQLLPIILFSILFSAALTTIGEPGRTVLGFFHGGNEAMMKLVSWIMYFAPIGIFGLVAGRLGQAGGGEQFMSEIKGVGWHIVTVLTGLGLHFMFLTLVMVFLARRGLGYYKGLSRAYLTAFGTASSSATLPLTLACAREEGIDEQALRFTIPLGATINMDGTALYESAAAMFIAQAYGMDLGVGQQMIIFLTATLAAIGAAGIPEAGLVTMVIVLDAVGIPLEGIGLLLSVDWFLDRFRTTVNVAGDTIGATVVHRFIRSGGVNR